MSFLIHENTCNSNELLIKKQNTNNYSIIDMLEYRTWWNF